MTTKLIKVTAEDIAQGNRKEPASCPVAKAISRELGMTANVGISFLHTIDPKHVGDKKAVWNKYPTPNKASRFIQRFDRQMPVEPFEFELEMSGMAPQPAIGDVYGYQAGCEIEIVGLEPLKAKILTVSHHLDPHPYQFKVGQILEFKALPWSDGRQHYNIVGPAPYWFLRESWNQLIFEKYRD